MSDRHFSNIFPPYDGQAIINERDSADSDVALIPSIHRSLLEGCLCVAADAERGQIKSGSSDTSVYTGSSGLALLYLRLWDLENDRRWLSKAKDVLKPILKHLKRRGVTFLRGDAGPLAIAAVVYHHLGSSASEDCIARLVDRVGDVVSDRELPDELLNGRAGYLYSLLFVRSKLSDTACDSAVIRRVVESILSSGKSLSRKLGCSSPLMFEWHDKQYLGAAHGLTGILLALIQSAACTREELDTLVRPTLDWMLSLQMSSGNFPSSVGNDRDRLVHWCHGAPGWINLLLLAYQTWKTSRYMEAALQCGEVIWSRGLLRKGCGLCHGAAGNGYAFLSLYRATNDTLHLYRAYKFASWCVEYDSHGCTTPDRPFSLFEGIAGAAYFIADVIQPTKARFPAFEV